MAFVRNNTDIRGLAQTPNTGNTRGIITGGILLTDDAVFSSVSTLRLSATLDALIVAKKAFVIQGVKETEVTVSEDLMYTSQTNEKVPIMRGVETTVFKLWLDEDQAYSVYDWEGKNWKFIPFDSNNNGYARKVSSGFEGFTVGMLRVGTITKPTKDSLSFVNLTIEEKDQNERREDEVIFKPEYKFESKWGVLRVTVDAGAVTSNVFDVTVSYDSTRRVSSSNAYETALITGLTASNFTVINNSGVVITPTSITESATVKGTYTVTCSAFTTGTIQVKPTVGFLYESEITTV